MLRKQQKTLEGYFILPHPVCTFRSDDTLHSQAQ